MKRFPWISLVLLLIGYISFGWYLSGLESPQPVWLATACYQVFGLSNGTQSHGTRSPGTGIEKPAEPHSNHSSKGAEEHLQGESKAIAPESSKTLDHPGEAKTAPPLHATGEAKGMRAKPQESGIVEEQSKHSKGLPNTVNPGSESGEEAKGEATHSEVGGKSAIADQPHHFCSQAIKHNLAIALPAVGWILFSSMMFMSPLSSFSRFINRWFQSDTVAFMTVFLIAGITTLILFWLHVALQILTILAAESLARIDIQIKGLNGMHAFWILTLISLTGLAAGWLANGVL